MTAGPVLPSNESTPTPTPSVTPAGGSSAIRKEPSEAAALSRELADFLLEFSIALHKNGIYPKGHPLLEAAVAGVSRKIGILLNDSRPTLSIGVARKQLIIEGVATDAKHPVLGELASRLHRHSLGAVR